MEMNAVAALARYISYGDVERIIASWKMSRAEADQLRFTMDWIQETKDRGFPMGEHEAKGCIAVHNIPVKWILDYYDTIRDPEGIRSIIRDWECPTFPINGNDIINAGVKPGKAIGEILDIGRVCWATGFEFDGVYVEAYQGTKEQILSALDKVIKGKIND
jgi:hypothetical protein